jgi:hypothetical protein
LFGRYRRIARCFNQAFKETMTDRATTTASGPPADPSTQAGQGGVAAGVSDVAVTITQLEAAINYWRAREPSCGDEMKLGRQAAALSRPYALMIVQRRRSLALSELEPNALAAFQAYETLGKASG